MFKAELTFKSTLAVNFYTSLIKSLQSLFGRFNKYKFNIIF